MGKIEPTLLALAESVRSFKEDADLEVCLGKCTICMPGIPKERAHQLIRDCIDADESGTLETLRPMLAHDLDVIQVQGLCVVGTPMGASQDVREYVRSKCGTICNDVEQMRVCSDPLIRYQLLKFCMNTRLSFLSRNVTPDNMASCCDPLDRAHIGPAHVDQKIVHEVLRAATSDTIRVSDPKYGWCTLKVQSPHHEGGYAITPTAASGLAAFYSATSKLVALLASLPDNYQHDYNERNFFFLPAVMTTSGRISGDFLRLLYILSNRQAHKYFTRMGLLDPSTKAFKQRRGTYFYYNRAAIGLACAQATAMRIDIAPHKRPLKKLPHHAPDPHLFHIPSHALLHD